MIEERFEAEKLFLEEWKANNELFKWHEDLKQKRFSFFLSFQTAFLAGVVLLVKGLFSQSDSLHASSKLSDISILIMVIIISAMALIVVRAYASMDKRARAFVDTIKSKLLIIEKNWKDKFPNSSFSTYHEQFAILVHRHSECVLRYQNVRNIKGDKFTAKVFAPAAHMTEELLFRCFTGIWILFTIAATICILIAMK
jgi:Tfp pilus assembly protein PilE